MYDFLIVGAGISGAVFAHDHVRVFHEIAVDGETVFGLSQMYPIRL